MHRSNRWQSPKDAGRSALRRGGRLLLVAILPFAVYACRRGGRGHDGLGPDDTAQIYDAAGRLVEERDARGNQVHFDYDAAGNLLGIRVIETEQGAP